MTIVWWLIGLVVALVGLLAWWTKPWPRPEKWKSPFGRVSPRY